MLGSTSTYFYKDLRVLKHKWILAYSLLLSKGYAEDEIVVYENAYHFFTSNPHLYDGATVVKDLVDIPGLDLDAMLHDFHYVHYNAAANFATKWKADWLYAKGQERKGKGQYSAFSRFVGLTIIGIGFIVYANYKRGKINALQKEKFLNEYQTLNK